MKKKALALALAIVLCLSLFPATALADGDFTIENGVLTEYNGSGGAVTIPSGVTEIGRGAFSLSKVTSVTIPTGVTKIGHGAFDSCFSLTSITIPDSVTEIGATAFSDCIRLTSVNIPKGVTVIESGLFLRCSGLTSVTIPAGVTKIEELAFGSCTSLTGITLPDSLTILDSSAFASCPGLTSVTIPAGVNEIDQFAFSGCTGLTSVTISDGVAIIGPSAFARCTGLTDITIPDSVTKIGATSFYGCTGLTSVKIPDGVTRLWMGAFSNCTSLTSVTIPASVTTIGSSTPDNNFGAFEECPNLTDVYYGGSEDQWNAIEFINDDDLTNATIHYNSNGTGTENPPTPAIPSTGTAYSSTQGVGVDGKTVEFQAYALKDANGNDTNYIKLRDVAHVLKGTGAQFSVGWDGTASTITATSGETYQDVGSEMNTPFSGNRAYTVSNLKLMINGKIVNVQAILLKDDKGDGYTYYKLRDLGKELNFNVSWSAERGIYINTDQPYSDAN